MIWLNVQKLNLVKTKIVSLLYSLIIRFLQNSWLPWIVASEIYSQTLNSGWLDVGATSVKDFFNVKVEYLTIFGFTYYKLQNNIPLNVDLQND